MRTWALIPAHNEEARVGATVAAAVSLSSVEGVLVVDDASTDATADFAERAGAMTLRLPVNSGKGGALEAGMVLVPADVDVVLLLDADLGESAIEAEALLAPVLDGAADMTIATFPKPAGKAGFGLVMGLARTGIRLLGGEFDATAPLSGQRAIRRDLLAHITPFASGFGVEVALTIRALRQGARVLEVPTRMTHAATGRDFSGFSHRGRQFADVAATLVRLALSSRKP